MKSYRVVLSDVSDFLGEKSAYARTTGDVPAYTRGRDVDGNIVKTVQTLRLAFPRVKSKEYSSVGLLEEKSVTYKERDNELILGSELLVHGEQEDEYFVVKHFERLTSPDIKNELDI